MSAQRFPPDDPREWLNRARSNLAKARAAAEPATQQEYEEALAIAEAVIEWAEQAVELRSASNG